jgi:glycine/D-amino acid oxidase-like deaminating enzyme
MHVGIVGAGITGCSAALMLARRGARVTLLDQAAHPFAGASRWNEGKIHLGYLYAADPSLATVRRLLPGGLAFRPLVEELLSSSLLPATTRQDDLYLVHRDSVVDVSAMRRHVETVTSMASAHPAGQGYLTPLRDDGWRELPRDELPRRGTDEIAAGFVVPERSVSTRWVADRFVQALGASDVEFQGGTRVTAVRSVRGSTAPPYALDVVGRGRPGAASLGPFDVVVNAAWEGRPALDASLGLPPPDVRSHRYRLAVFVRTRSRRQTPRSTVVSTGPFGDVKNYDGHDFYLSWYPVGLVAQGEGVSPPQVDPLTDEDHQDVIDGTVGRLRDLVPGIHAVMTDADEVAVAGGWVYAAGRGSLSDPMSSLHRRERVGTTRVSSYFSVDTGKFSIGPWLARELAETLTG